MTMPEPFEDRTAEPHIHGFLHEPDDVNGNVILLTHGAGGNCQSKVLIEVSNAFAAAGFTVLRFDLPFRNLRRFGPPRPGDAARDREGILRAVALMRERQRADTAKHVTQKATDVSANKGAKAKTSTPSAKGEGGTQQVHGGRIFLGGHSYGGRQATILASEVASEISQDSPSASATDSLFVDALLLLSYPLHPPKKPEQLRTGHFPKLNTPAFFVHGTRDPFANSDEMNSALKLIPARHAMLEVEGVGHDLLAKKGGGELPARIVNEFQAFVIKSMG